MYVVKGENLNYKWQPYYSKNAYIENVRKILLDDCSEIATSGEKVLFISDIHFGSSNNIDDLTKGIKKAIKEENKVSKINCIFVIGDLGNDYTATSGNHYVFKEYGESFVKDLKAMGIQTYVVHGNHDMYTDSEWVEAFKNTKTFKVETPNSIFLCMDVFDGEHYIDGSKMDAIYPTDIKTNVLEYFTSYIADKNKEVFIVSHYSYNGKNYNALVDNPKVKGIFAGHVHAPYEQSYRNKPMNLCGSFSTLEPNQPDWTYRILECCGNQMMTYHVAPAMELKGKEERTVGEAKMLETLIAESYLIN